HRRGGGGRVGGGTRRGDRNPAALARSAGEGQHARRVGAGGEAGASRQPQAVSRSPPAVSVKTCGLRLAAVQGLRLAALLTYRLIRSITWPSVSVMDTQRAVPRALQLSRTTRRPSRRRQAPAPSTCPLP